MSKYDLVKKLIKEQVDRRFHLTTEAVEALGKEVEMRIEPILKKAQDYALKENRAAILAGDIVKSINAVAGKKEPRILIAHVTAGAGHQRAAEAIAKAFAKHYPNANVKLVDTLDYTNSVYKTVYGSTYLAMVKYTPKLWGYFYDRYDKDDKLDDKIRQTIENMQAGDLRELLDDFVPDAVICTHFLPMELISRWKKKRKSSLPLYAVVTDFALHAFWIVEEVDAYFVASREAAREMVSRGAKVKNVYQTGIPVDPVFAELPLQSELRAKLNLNRDLPTVLIMGGGYGVGDITSLLRSFQSVTAEMQLMVVAGKNETLKNELIQVSRLLHIPCKVFGFVTNIHELMGAADLVVTKPGGLSSSEALASHRPLMVMNPIPGQEQRNCDYLLEQGVASILHDIKDGAYYIEELLKNKERLAYMTQQARNVGQTEASAEIARQVIALAKLDI